MNRTEMATATRRYLNELSVSYIGTGMLYDAINEANSQLNAEAKYNRLDATIDIDSGAPTYTLSGTILDVFRVRLGTGSQRRRLEPTDVHRLDIEGGDWEAQGRGTPTEYFTNGGVIGFVNPLPAKREPWKANTLYAAGAIVVPTTPNGFTYIALNAGTSGGTQPTWPQAIDATVTDNTIVWKQAGHTRVYVNALHDVPAIRNGTGSPSWCPTLFHRTICKLAAVVVAGGYNAESEGSQPRLAKLYNEYLRERERLQALAANRSAEYVPKVSVRGYSGFRLR